MQELKGVGETALLLDKRKILERVYINPINTGLFELLLLVSIDSKTAFSCFFKNYNSS